MANIDPLPLPVDEVEIPSCFSVSTISREIECELKLVLTSTPHVPALPVHPNAEIGRLFHDLIERAIKGRIDRSGSPQSDAKREFNRLLAAAEERLKEKKNTRRYANLSGTMSPLRWRQRKTRAVKAAARWLERSSSQSSYAKKGHNHSVTRSSYGPSFHSLGDSGCWTEVSIYDEDLRLAGRMDLVEKKGDRVVIRDFKTGRVKNGEGEILAHIRRQLQLYGLMVKRATPTSQVELIVEGQREYVIRFDHETITQTEDWVRKLASGLAKGKNVAATELARPGVECTTCRHRHVCSAYLRSAPHKWGNKNSYRLPLDIGGTVKSVTEGYDSLIDIVLIDEAGRRVKIFALTREHAELVRENSDLWFFNLNIYRRSHNSDHWRHPLNFYEVSVDEPSNTAWTLRIYENA